MTFAPRFSPDGQRIVMSFEQEGNSNIFAMDLRSRRTTQLTNDQRHRHLALLFAGRDGRSCSRATATARSRSMS